MADNQRVPRFSWLRRLLTNDSGPAASGARPSDSGEPASITTRQEPAPRTENTGETSGSWFSDDANASLAASLGRADFLERAWEVIRDTRALASSTVFGLVGRWGSGKSSMLQWLRERAEADDETPRWRFVSFNPWDFADAASLQRGFFAELHEAFPDPKSELRSRIAAFSRAVSPLTSLVAIFGLDPSKALDGFATLVEGDTSAANARARLVQALAAAKTPVLVIIDDLDRISADELLLTLKLVRQIGRLPFVHYLLSYDEVTILDVLTRTNLVGKGTPARARDYMEKVVQVRFDVPALRASDALMLTNAALEKLAEETGFELTESDSARYATAYFRFLAPRLDTPRAIRRYFAQVRLLSSKLLKEVDHADFLVLTWLRTSEPGVYALLQQRRAELVGPATRHSRGTSAQEQRDEAIAVAARWRSAFIQSGSRENDVDGVAQAVAFLFPRFAAVLNQGIGSGDDVAELRLANDSYFDRYFSFGIPDDDIADATVRAAVESFATGEPDRNAAVLRVRIALLQNAGLVVDKLSREITRAGTINPQLDAWLARIYRNLPASQEVLSPSRQIENLLADRLRGMTPQQATQALHAAIQEGGIELLMVALDKAMHTTERERPPLVLAEPQLEQVRTAFGDLLRVEGATPLTMRPRIRSEVWMWSRIDPTGFSEWLASERAAHGDLDALGFFVGSSSSGGRHADAGRLHRFQAGDAAIYFDLTEMRDKYAREVDDSPELEVDDFDGPADTAENRRLITLNALRQIAAPSADPDDPEDG